MLTSLVDPPALDTKVSLTAQPALVPSLGETTGGGFLVIGYGNPLRSDDAAGQHVAEIVAAWNLENVRSLAVHQLTPELAEPLATAQLAIFVDVYVANDEQATVQIIDLNKSATADPVSGLGHSTDPRSLLKLAEQVYGTAPPSWWILMPAIHFEFGEQLSPTTQRGVEVALTAIFMGLCPFPAT